MHILGLREERGRSVGGKFKFGIKFSKWITGEWNGNISLEAAVLEDSTMKAVLIFFLVNTGADWLVKAEKIHIGPYLVDLNKLTMPTLNPGLDPVKEIRVSNIIQGQDAKDKQFPYQAAIFLGADQISSFCGGTLISSRTILTAAHCLEGMRTAYVCLGATNLYDQGQRKIYRVQYSKSTFIIHKNWNAKKLINDIALLILPGAVPFSESIKPIPIHSTSETLEENISTVSGWGKTSDRPGGITTRLKFLNTLVQKKDQCFAYYNEHLGHKIDSSNICTSGEKKEGTCQGDSGGPLVAKVKNVHKVIGIVSFGLNLCEYGAPSVYTRVNSFVPWIKSNMKE